MFLKKILLILVLLVAFYIDLSAQKEAHSWRFHAAFKFKFSGELYEDPIIENNPNTFINYFESPSCISDPCTGELLYSTDGFNIYDTAGVVIKNGDDIGGHNSSKQGPIIFPLPGNDSIYYVFVADDITDAFSTHHGISLTIINVNGDSGRGEVLSKNQTLNGLSYEGLSAVHHANKRDIWVTARVKGIRFISWLVSTEGIIDTVESFCGDSINEDFPSGFSLSAAPLAICFSPNGKWIAMSTRHYQDLYSFNNETGIVSNPIRLSNRKFGEHATFSRSSHKLYLTIKALAGIDTGMLLQYDLSSPDSISIVNSEVILESWPRLISNEDEFYDIALAPNGKIYVFKWQEDSLGVINEPDKKGIACNYVPKSFEMPYQAISAPNFVQSYLDPEYSEKWNISAKIHMHDSVICKEGSLDIVDSSQSFIASRTWLLGDSVLDTLQSVSFYSDHVGVDTITMLVADKCNYWRDTISEVVYTSYNPSFIGEDTILCENIDGLIVRDSQTNVQSRLWSTGSLEQAITVYESGEYIVATEDHWGCESSDTIGIVFENCRPIMFIPNAFRVNNMSSLFRVYTENIVDYNLKIFDRYGLLVFEAKMNDSEVWDGVYDKMQVNVGVYSYHITYQAVSGEKGNQIGNITVL